MSSHSDGFDLCFIGACLGVIYLMYETCFKLKSCHGSFRFLVDDFSQIFGFFICLGLSEHSCCLMIKPSAIRAGVNKLSTLK